MFLQFLFHVVSRKGSSVLWFDFISECESRLVTLSFHINERRSFYSSDDVFFCCCLVDFSYVVCWGFYSSFCLFAWFTELYSCCTFWLTRWSGKLRCFQQFCVLPQWQIWNCQGEVKKDITAYVMAMNVKKYAYTQLFYVCLVCFFLMRLPSVHFWDWLLRYQITCVFDRFGDTY